MIQQKEISCLAPFFLKTNFTVAQSQALYKWTALILHIYKPLT